MQSKPVILLPGSFSIDDLNKLRGDNQIWKTVDVYDSQVEELAEVHHADGDLAKRQAFIEQKGNGDLAGAWVYYPWSGILMHCVGEDDLFTLRTNRNQNLITKEEQQKLAGTTVAVAGMSVGSGIALSCVYSGMSNTVKLSDFDTLSTANLNRLRESLTIVGVPKVDIAAQHVYEVNPFAEVQAFDRVSADNIDAFLSGASVLFDEIDDFKMKIRLRIAAKAARVPVIMLASLGDSIVVDIERYDLEPELPILNGLLGELPEEILAADIGKKEEVKYAMELVGIENIPTRALDTLLQINKTLRGRPQLYSTIAVDGGLSAYMVRRLALGLPLPSGRIRVSFDEALHVTTSDDRNREDIIDKLNRLIA